MNLDVYKNKPLYVARPTLPELQDFTESLIDIWDSKMLTNQGGNNNKLRCMIASFLGTSNFELLSHGHTALDVAIKSLELKGDIITTPFTFASTTSAIILNGCRPVFCDIGEDYNICCKEIESNINSNTSAILATHTYGHPCEVKCINEIAARYNLKVIYDGAHAFGVKINNISLCQYGDATMYSFHATKAFHTIEGGGLSFQDTQLKERIQLLRNFGIRDEETIELAGINGKMNEIQAVIGILNLPYFERDRIKRKRINDAYRTCLSNIDALELPRLSDEVTYNYSYFPVEFVNTEVREKIYKRLKSHNIHARKYFYPLTSEMRSLGIPEEQLRKMTPRAHQASRCILCLPIHADMEEIDAERVIHVINNSFKDI